MKNRLKISLLIAAMSTITLSDITAKNYYVDSGSAASGNGLSADTPVRELREVNTSALVAGDSVLLRRGATFAGTIELRGLSGTADAPIVIATYGDDKSAPTINAQGMAQGILIENCSHVELRDLRIIGDGRGTSAVDEAKKRKMRCAVVVEVTKDGNYKSIAMRGLRIENMFYNEKGFSRDAKEVRTANGTQPYGWGIRVFNTLAQAILSGVTIEKCHIENVAHTGVKFGGTGHNITDIEVCANQVLRSGGPGIQMSGVKRAHVADNTIERSGSNDDSRKWGRGSGYWCWGASDIIVERNNLLGANGPGDSAGAHIDYNCSNIVYQYNFSANNIGGFCEILGNNHNCSYRYNISVNDGEREKDINGAFHEGKVLWFSGYVGNTKRNGPYNSYVYNNTIYVEPGRTSRMAIGNTSDGLLIANNIFCIGKSSSVLGDQFNPEKQEGGARARNVVFENNLFLSQDSWSAEIPIQDSKPIYGDPRFRNTAGRTPFDFTPQATRLIKNKGIKIAPLSGDKVGLAIGLDVEQDILGNKIKGAPDMGAIEIK